MFFLRIVFLYPPNSSEFVKEKKENDVKKNKPKKQNRVSNFNDSICSESIWNLSLLNIENFAS